MNKTHALYGFSMCLAMTVFGAGCSAADAQSEEDPTTTTPNASNPSGLTIAEQRSDLVRGTLERNDITIGFTFSVDAKNVHHAKVWDADGTILDSTLDDGYEVTSYLDGKARVSGSLHDAEPIIEGDKAIFDALNARPSALLFFELRDALIDAGVPRTLVAASRATAPNGVSPQAAGPNWFILKGYESRVVPTTWQAWVTTLFRLSAFTTTSTSGCVQALTGWSAPTCSGPLVINSWGWTTGARYYGYSVKVTNNAATLWGAIPWLRVDVTEH